MKLMFIGEDGSMGLERFKKYDCRISADIDSNWIWVAAYTGKLVCRCPYTSIRKLLENWIEI